MLPESLLYCPPVRGKMKTLYPSHFFLLDCVLFVFTALLPRPARRAFASRYEKRLSESLFPDYNVREQFDILYVDNGTSALVSAFKLIRLAKGERVYLNSNTCTAVGESILASGGEPAFLTTNYEGLTDDSFLPNDVAGRTVVLLTNTYGFLENVRSLKARKPCPLIINDLSQANIVSPEFRAVCEESELIVLSFGPEKYVGGLGGGALLVKKDVPKEIRLELSILSTSLQEFMLSAQLKKIVNRLRYIMTFVTVNTLLYGILKSVGAAYTLHPSKDIEYVLLLRDSIMPRRISLPDIMSITRRIRWYSRRQSEERGKYKLLVRAIEQKNRTIGKESVSPMLILRCTPETRYAVAKSLASKGFQTTWNYTPLFMSKPFRNFSCQSDNKLWQSILQVPYRFLTHAQLVDLGNAINYAFKNN